MRREIREIFKGKAVTEGAGVKLRRIFGFAEPEMFDPFLMLDDFRSDNPEDFLAGFPWHPHRGIETITYVTKGDVEHGDSLGNKGVIGSGDVQWMTAGSGIIHQEMPKGDKNGSMHGFQLWANLPANDKMMNPRYRGITADQIPEVLLENGVEIKIIAGRVGDVSGPMDDIVIEPEYMDCTVPAVTEFVHPTKLGHTAMIYVVGGKGSVNGTSVENRTLILFGDGDEFAISGSDEPVRFLLLTGKPLNEPIAWRGPIVMNTQKELDIAFKEYQDGTFIKHS
ncbi:pirin family protein [Maridesulfovibrio sp.]|uniref:pirin family protein n=1 Tax=Maridesulfovibrio sp. TaxID=2795000 RepID=UPI0039EE761E